MNRFDSKSNKMLDTHDWNFTDLIGAFLNLYIACMLLCTSLCIHLSLSFLGFLGLSLPKFHNGRFCDTNMRRCLLLDYASDRISSVDRSIKCKIPFGLSSSDNDLNKLVELKLVRENSSKDETEDLSREDEEHKDLGRFNLMTRRSRNGVRKRRRGRVRSVSSSEAFDASVKSCLMQPYDVFVRSKDERSSNCDSKGDRILKRRLSLSHWPESDKIVSVHEQHIQKHWTDTENSVKDLVEALKEERTARAAICIELEKERSAAASAADEAMAMIHRLQDEKAIIKMESRQFQRMVEEKSSFDAEEMIILKDILIRREREKHFLEKEVEAYRQILEETDELTQREKNLLQDSNTKTALFVQEFDMPETNRDKNRDLYKSDSEVAYSHERDVYMVKDETVSVRTKKKNVEEESLERSSVIVSGIARKLPPLCRPRKKSQSFSGSRRKSMSAVDYERLKIENEVEQLRERLKTVQEERERLTRRASLPSFSSKF